MSHGDYRNPEQRSVNSFAKKLQLVLLYKLRKGRFSVFSSFCHLTSFCILFHAQLDSHHTNTLTLIQSNIVRAWFFHSLCLSPTPSRMAESWLGLQPHSSQFSPLLGLHPGPLLDVPSSSHLPAGPAWCLDCQGVSEGRWQVPTLYSEGA